VARCLEETAAPAVRAVQTFLNADPLSQIRLDDSFDPGASITFRIDGECPTDLPSVQAFWAAVNDPSNNSAPIMQCVVCGRKRPALERLELKIKGVPGGQMSGTSVISFNADAFESYGLTASLNAPTCSACGERFTKAANHLLASDSNSIRLNNVAYIWWPKEPVDTSFMALLAGADPDPEQIQLLLSSATRGKEGATGFDETPFYATALAGSGGRCVVRDWIDTTVGEAKQHLIDWFALQRITDWNGDTWRPLSLRQLAYATVRSGDRNNPAAPNVSRTLLDAALTGALLPHDLLYQAVRRCRAEQGVSRQRAALIKMVLLSRHMIAGNGTEDYMVVLEETERDPAYLCGRLLAVIEQAQRAAMPGVNATIVDRFYGTASSAPASVFGRLMRGLQPHLSKLERDRKGAWVGLQRRIEEVTRDLGTFPRTLTLQEQGLFALGYYHERARRFAGKTEPADAESDTKNDEAGVLAAAVEEE
jgi:CRISPR-associated protein Csd1